MAKREFYAYDKENDRYVLITTDDNGNILDVEEVPPETAIYHISNAYTSGEGFYEHDIEANRIKVDSPNVLSEGMLAEFMEPGILDILDTPNYADTLRQITNNVFVLEIARDYGLLPEDIISAVWPDHTESLPLDPSESNIEGFPVVREIHVKKIDGTERQGIGRLTPPQYGYDPRYPRIGSGRGGDSGGGGAASPPAKTGGEPVVLFSGQFYHQVTDLEVNGRGLYFSFTRTYLHQVLYNGPLGFNWDHTYNLWIREAQEVTSDGTIRNVAYRSNGQLRQDAYIQILDVTEGDLVPLGEFSDSVFEPPPGFFDRLEKINGRYVMETVEGIRYEYNDNMFIGRIVDKNGNEMTFEYNDHMLSKIRDPVGKEFTFGYDELNRIVTLHDVTGSRKICYYYGDNGDLEEVDQILPPDIVLGTHYLYSDKNSRFNLRHNLVEIISPMGHSVLENEYGISIDTWEFNRVIRQRSLDGEYRYEYDIILESDVDPTLDPINVPKRLTRVRYPNGHVIEHWFNDQGNVVRRSENVLNMDTGLVEQITSIYRYNEDGLLTKQVLPEGEVLEFHYQRELFSALHGDDTLGATPRERYTFGNLLQVVERPRPGLDESRVIVLDFRYHAGETTVEFQKGPYYADPVLLQPLPDQTISEVTFIYDTRRNITSIQYPDAALPDGATRTIASPVFVYNDHGLVTDIQIGTLHTQYIYFADLIKSGFVREVIQDPGGSSIRTFYEVDELGRITKIIDKNNLETAIDWTSFDTPSRITLPEIGPDIPRASTNYEYDRNRQLTRLEKLIVLPDGMLHKDESLVGTFFYDNNIHLVQQSFGSKANPYQSTTKAMYNEAGLPDREIDSMGNSNLIKYDERMNVSTIVRGYGSEEETSQLILYNRSGERVGFVDGRGFKTVVRRDVFGRPHTIIDSNENELQREYDASGRVVLQRMYGRHPETDAKVRWTETEFKYDSVGSLIEVIDHQFIPGSLGHDELLVSQYFYDSLNYLETFKDPSQNEWVYKYDHLGRLIGIADPVGNEVSYIYDEVGSTITTINKEVGNSESDVPVVQFFTSIINLDSRGLPSKETDSMGNAEFFAFDSRGLLTRIIDARGQEYNTDYNVFGEPLADYTHIDNHEIRIETAYDSNGNISKIISPVGGTITFGYDALNRLTKIMRDNNNIIYGYDKEDNLILRQDENGVVTNLTYNGVGLLQSEEYDLLNFSPPPDNPSYMADITTKSEYKYTPLGNLAIAKNQIHQSTMRYDSLGRLVEEINNGLSISYRHNETGQKTGMTLPSGRDISYDYLANGVFKSIQQNTIGLSYPGNHLASPSRNLASIWKIGSRPLSMRLSESILAKLSYDGARRIVGIDWTDVTDGSQLRKERNLYGNTYEWKLQHLDDHCRILSYDKMNRLVNVQDYESSLHIDVTGIAPPSVEDNILAGPQQEDVNSLIESVETELQGTTPIRNFTYQLNENNDRLETEEINALTGITDVDVYVPDDQDRYQSVDGQNISYDRSGNLLNDGFNSYRYDAHNRLVQITTALGSLQISYDALGRPVRTIAPTGIKDYLYSGSRLIEWRINGNVDAQLIPLEQQNQYAILSINGEDYSPMFDVMGSVTAWVSLSDGEIVGTSTYDPFGQVMERGPRWPGPFGFAGYWHEEISRLYRLFARIYDPRLGRYLQRDPLGLVDGSNLYAYARHSPGTLTDYLGFRSQDVGWEEGSSNGTERSRTGHVVDQPDPSTFGKDEEEEEEEEGTADEPGTLESLIPVWGSLRSAIYHGQKGEWGWAAVHGVLAITDVFLVKQIVAIPAKALLSSSIKKIARKGGEKLLRNESVHFGSVGAMWVRPAARPAKMTVSNVMSFPLAPAKSSRPILIGDNTRVFRNMVQQRLRADPDNPLKFLLNSRGRFRRTWGRRHSALLNDPRLVQMGHVVTRGAGKGEIIVLQNAWLNQFDNLATETGKIGGFIQRHIVEIGGIGVEARTAKMWVDLGWVKSWEARALDFSSLFPGFTLL